MKNPAAALPLVLLLSLSAPAGPAGPVPNGERRAGRASGEEATHAAGEALVSTGHLCAGRLHDVATGACLVASSAPALGRLYPLGPELMIDAAGRVGVGTTAPAEALDVAGTIRARAGGVRFPDGTLQASAALPADPEPRSVLGTVDFSMSSLGCGGGGPSNLYALEHGIQRPAAGGNATFDLAFSKDVDACSAALLGEYLGGSSIGDVVFTVGSLAIKTRGTVLTSVEMIGGEDGLPRERVGLTATVVEYDDSNGTSLGSWDFVLQSGGAAPSFAGQSLRFTVPGQGPVPPGDLAAYGTRHGVTGFGGGSFEELTVERRPDVATPSLLIACAAASPLPTVDAVVLRFDGSKDVPYLRHGLTSAQVTSLRLSVHPLEGWKETLTLDYASAVWELEVNGVRYNVP